MFISMPKYHEILKVIPLKVIEREFKKFAGKISELLLLYIVVSIFYLLVLNCFNIFWSVYVATPVGQEYKKKFYEMYLYFENLLAGDLLLKPFEISFNALILLLAVSALLNFFHISRYLYYSRGLIGKLVIFVLPVTFGAAWIFTNGNDLYSLKKGFTVYIFPVSLLIFKCFDFSREFVPEIGELKRKLSKYIIIIMQIIRKKL